LTWTPATCAIALIVIVACAWLASVPRRQRIGRPVVQLPRSRWIETTFSGRLDASSTRTSCAAFGPALVTVIV
jgi:hypothetical protein